MKKKFILNMRRKFSMRHLRIALGGIAIAFAALDPSSVVLAQDTPPPPVAAPDTVESSSPTDPYRLDPGDFLRVYIFGVEELSGDYRVDAKGVITMPLIGGIDAQGLNKDELQQKITSLLVEDGYYNDPKVTVEVLSLKPFYILGEVRTPGSYEYQVDLDIFKAVAIAGGYTPRAAKGDITIIRKVNGEKVTIDASEDTPILPGDSIKVDQRFF